MACSIKSKTIDHLREKGAINSLNEVIDYTLFDKLNNDITVKYYNKYVVGDGKRKLFTVDTETIRTQDGDRRTINKIVPNELLFQEAEEYNSTEPLHQHKEDMNDTEPILNVVDNDEILIQGESESDLINFTFFNGQITKNEYEASEIVDNILKNYGNLSPLGQDLLYKLQLLSGKSKAKVTITPNKEYFVDNDATMLYYASANEILINPDILNGLKLDRAIQTFLHELVHSLTVNAVRNPVTMEQKMLKDYIFIAFTEYKERSDNQELYGFTRPEEFISEIFSNPIFIEEIKHLDRKSGVRNTIWDKIVDFVRTMLGLPKYHILSKISYNGVIDSIINLSNTEGVPLRSDNSFFASKANPKKTTLKTIDEKVADTITRITDNIKESIKKSEFFYEISKEGKGKDRLEKYISRTKNILNEIESYSLTNQLKSVTTFLTFMEGNLSSIRNRLTNKTEALTVDELKKMIELHESYMEMFSVISNVNETISALRVDDVVTKEFREKTVTDKELDDLEIKVSNMTGQYTTLRNRLHELKKETLKETLHDIKWFPQLEKQHYDRLSKEHADSKIIEDKETWIIDKMRNRDRQLIQDDLTDAVNSFIENPMNDIMADAVMLNSPINVSSPMIQVAHQMLTNINNDRLEEELTKDKEFRDLFNELTKEKGSNNPNVIYKNILQFDKDGKPYLLGEYDIKFYTEVHQKIQQLRKEYRDKLNDISSKRAKAELTFGVSSTQYKNLEAEYKKTYEQRNKAIKKLEEENIDFVKVEGSNKRKATPKAKWKNKVVLTPTEEKVKNFFINIILESNKSTLGQDPLMKFSYGAIFFELPKITKTDKERALKGDFKSIVSDKYTDLTETRPDDVDYVERHVDQNNEVIKRLQIHYRDRKGFDHKQQSLDLFGIFRKEYKNANKYKHRKRYELDLNFLLDIAKNKKYHQKEGTRLVTKHNTNKINNITGKESNTYKMLSNMLESRFYDINKRHNIKWGPLDANKAISFVNGASSFLALSLNLASGTANVVNANAQLFLESFIKGKYIKAGSIAKANAIYAKNMPDTVADNIRPVSNSFVNKVNEYFNVWGISNFTNTDFIRSDMVKRGFSRQSLQVFQDSGEHWVQSIISMSVLDGIKVLNKDGMFINKDGKVVSEKEAASLLDMMKVDESKGIMTVDSNVVYTTHSRLTEWNKGGKDKVDALISKKIYDSVGNYRDIDQPEIMRHWYGPLIFLFRRYLIPMGVSRLRGMAYSYKDKSDLTEDHTKFSYALQEFEEGTYTTLLRYMFRKFRDMKYYLLNLNNESRDSIESAWDGLSDYEKHNIKRAVTELVMTWGILPISAQFVAAAAADADDEYLFFLAYQLRRLDTELSQYRSIEESFKVIRSPIPSARLIETTSSILLQVMSPWQWHTLDDVYEKGLNKDQNKLKVKALKQMPALKEFYRTYQDLYEYQNSKFGTGL